MIIELEARINQHAAYINTDKVIQMLEEIQSSNLPAVHVQMLGRINESFVFLKEAFDKVDPWLVSINTLANINNNISQILNLLSNYKSNKNEQHLTNAISHLEAMLQYFVQFTVIKTSEDVEGVRSSVISFRKSVGQHLANVEKEIDNTSLLLKQNSEKLNDLTGAIESQKSRIDTVVNDFQKQFLQNQTQMSSEFNNFIKTREEDFNKVIKSNSEQLEQLLTNQEDTFKKLMQDLEQQKITEKASYENLVEELKDSVQEELNKIKEMNKEAENILGLMSMKGLAQGYQKIANSEGKKAFWWNVISITSLLGILWFAYEFIIKHEGEMNWTALFSRVLITGVGITLFTYCAKQATNHRFEERRNRKIELELASLDPYLKDFEPEKQKEVKQNLVDKYFGIELPNIKNKEQLTNQQNDEEMVSNIKQFLDIAEKVKQITNNK